MLRITLRSTVPAPFKIVKDGFNLKLLEYLTPPLSKLQMLRFDGIHMGAQMVFTIVVPGQKMQWSGEISHLRSTPNNITFIDQGITLPRGLKKWRHVHSVQSQNGRTIIIDRVELQGIHIFFTAYWYLATLYLLSIRPSRYKRYFKQ
jgi:ligand-binding SRPBCC domain-containing protein